MSDDPKDGEREREREYGCIRQYTMEANGKENTYNLLLNVMLRSKEENIFRVMCHI